MKNSCESGELSRKGDKNFSLPESETFKKIIKKRQENGNVYLQFMEKLIEKEKRYQKIEIECGNILKKRFLDKKKNKLLYLEKHRILPNYEGGTYKKNNVVLLTFAEHIMAHYFRFIQYGKVEDLRAYRIMLSDSNEKIRAEKASFAGQIGGRKQQELLRKQNLGWYNSTQQRQRGLKGSETSRQRGVGAFDPQNRMDANKEWQKKYVSDDFFRKKMKKNLFLGTLQRIGIVVFYYDNDNSKGSSVRYKAPSFSVSVRKGVEYTEERVHMSEDLFWYHLKFAERPGQSYKCRVQR